MLFSLPVKLLVFELLALPRFHLALLVPPQPNELGNDGFDSVIYEDAIRHTTNEQNFKMPFGNLQLSSISTDSANPDTGGPVELTWNNALPVGRVECTLSNAAGGWELSLESDWLITAYRKGDNTVVCSLPPAPEGAEGPMNLMVFVGSYQMLATPKKIWYATPFAVSFSEYPYFGASQGELLVRTNVTNPQGMLNVTARIGTQMLVNQKVEAVTKTVIPVPFNQLDATLDRTVVVELHDYNGKVRVGYRDLRLVRVPDKKRGRSAVDYKRRTLLVDGHPFLSIAWFSTYIDFGTESTIKSLRNMARRGVNSLLIYNLLEGKKQDPLAEPTTGNPNTEKILDAAAAMGIKMHISLLEITRRLASGLSSDYSYLDGTIRRWRDHPSLLSWYVADDDAGPFLPEVYNRIRKLDPYHIVTMAIAGVGHAFEQRFLRGSDVIMVENYPRDSMGAYTNMDTLNHWPLEFMPSITCGRAWAILEDGALVTPELFRSQLYSSLAAKTTGEIWFAYRNAGGWNEPGVVLEDAGGEAARELLDLASAIISDSEWNLNIKQPHVTTSTKTLPARKTSETGVVARAFVEDSGCVTLIVTNTLFEPVEATVKFAFDTAGIYDKHTTKTDALAAFELGENPRQVTVTRGELVEWMPSLGVQVFRFNGTSECAVQPQVSSSDHHMGGNVLPNPSFEELGAYISDPVNWQCGMSPNGGSGSACFADTHVKVDGRHSGRFATGTDIEAFHIHPEFEISMNGTYEGSIYAMSDKPYMMLQIGRSTKATRAYLRNKAPEDFEQHASFVLTDEWTKLDFSLPMWPHTQLTLKVNDTGVLWLDKAHLNMRMIDIRNRRLQELVKGAAQAQTGQ